MHANMIYINGEWISAAALPWSQNRWCRVDLTFAATALQNGGSTATVGDGTSYTDRYVYSAGRAGTRWEQDAGKGEDANGRSED